MDARVFDFADARPGKAVLDANGCVALSRYVKRWLPNSFDLSASERAQNLAWGYGQLYNPEQSASDIIEQSPAWWSDYGKYVADRLQGFGVDPVRVRPCQSADCFVTNADVPKAMNNFAAFATGVQPYRMIGYAQLNLLDLLVDEAISPAGAKHWLPGAISWSGLPNTADGWKQYQAYPHAGMVQMLSSPVPGTDMNIPIDLASMGFEWPESSPYYQGDAMPRSTFDSAGVGWIVADDFTSRYGADSGALFTAANATPIPMTDSELAPIQVVGQPTIGEQQILAALAELTNVIKAMPGGPVPAFPTAAEIAQAVVGVEAAKLGASS